jgi:hypothetical protein
MLKRTLLWASLVPLAMLFGLALLTPTLTAQSDKAPAAADKRNATSRLADASIYLRFPDQKKVELDLKTNQEGIARSPEIRQGKVLIQVVAQGWKTYGEYHDVTESEQTIQIHLVKPPIKWY